MKCKKVNVLGSVYSVKFGDKEEISLCAEHDGECRVFSKEILVNTGKDNLTEEELVERTKEIFAHEIFHAFVNESGVSLDDDVEEVLAVFFMKVWRKMNNTIMEVLDEMGFDN